MRQLFASPIYFPLLGLLCGVFGFRWGWRSGSKLVLPLVQGLFGFLAFAASWRSAGALEAVVAVGGWALGSTLISIAVFRGDPDETDRRVLLARPYREAMFEWLRSGRGPESRPLATLLEHLRETAVYFAAATLSANLAALIMGAVLLNYMNAYVARLLLVARRPWTVRLMGWNVWSVVRVAAFIVLGAAAAAPLMSLAGYPARPGEVRWLWIAGGVGLVVDLLLKLALSRPCGRRLAAAVDLPVLE